MLLLSIQCVYSIRPYILRYKCLERVLSTQNTRSHLPSLSNIIHLVLHRTTERKCWCCWCWNDVYYYKYSKNGKLFNKNKWVCWCLTCAKDMKKVVDGYTSSPVVWHSLWPPSGCSPHKHGTMLLIHHYLLYFHL